MAWFEKEMDYARESLEKASQSAITHASEKINQTMQDGIAQASGEIRAIVTEASHDVDAKLDKIYAELHSQRQFTKSDVKELVDYATEKLSTSIDQRVHVMKSEITSLVQERVEYFKHEVDSFFVQRQQDLARERRRLIANVLIAAAAAVTMGGLSLMYQRVLVGTMDMYGLFRIVFLSLSGGYGAYLLIKLLRKYRQMSEHKKDLVFLAMKYWGVLRPESLFGHVLLIFLLFALYGVLFFPELLAHWTGSEFLMKWAVSLRGAK